LRTRRDQHFSEKEETTDGRSGGDTCPSRQPRRRGRRRQRKAVARWTEPTARPRLPRPDRAAVGCLRGRGATAGHYTEWEQPC
jgi:hypothetical protein